MSAATHGDALPHQAATIASEAAREAAPLLQRWERLVLGLRLSVAMFAACLLCVAVGLRLLFVDARALSDLVAGAAALLVSVPVLAAAWHSLRHPSLHGVTDRLVALALVAAWAGGDLMTAALLPIIMTLGHVLEERSLLGSQEAIRALGRLTVQGARRLRADGTLEQVSADALAVGDLIELRAGDRLPADGIIRRGAASLDLATLTGESAPVAVAPGDVAPAGAVNSDGWLQVELTRIGGASTLGRIIALMREAEAAKPAMARLLDCHAGQYLLLVLGLAGGTWFVTQDATAMLAVLVAACPCALVLAAPATSVAAIAVAARHGILIKGSAFIEQLAGVTSVVFDKTGTITTGALRLVGVHPAPGVDPAAPLAVAGSLGVGSSHPVSRAAGAELAAAARLPVDGLREWGGLGLTATLQADGAAVAFGRPELLAQCQVAVSEAPVHDGPLAGVSRDGRFLGWLLFADAARPEAAAAVAELRALGLDRQMLLTGDRLSVATRIAAEVGITDICAEVLPEQKMDRVLAEIAAGRRPLVVGDGINDSLALRAGAVGVAMGAQWNELAGAQAGNRAGARADDRAGEQSRTADVALAAADLVLMTSDLRRLATCIRLSRRCRRTIHVNMAIGLGWTALLIAAAAAGLLGTEGAVVAALLHNVSTFAGLGNSGRLLLFDEVLAAPDAAAGPEYRVI